MRTAISNAHVRRASPYFSFLCFLAIFDLLNWALCITAITLSRNEHNIYAAELRAYHAAGGPNSKCTNTPNSCPPYPPRISMQWVLVSTLVPLVFDTSFLPPTMVFIWRDQLHTGVLLAEAVFGFVLWGSFGIMGAMGSVWGAWEVQPDTLDRVLGAIAGLQVTVAAMWFGFLVAAGRRLRRWNKGKGEGLEAAQVGVMRSMDSETTIAVDR